ncbi:hypothetical protein Gohar_017495 [Gossypium harknessii]|uniref:RNase H type-1 domain-containing protein n=1 Tax=Gossypium harknessii TaxID=34285 RepID=A0A7J9G698_9ROSI|nr:hypothetical protein [Gossypium harknessii]
MDSLLKERVYSETTDLDSEGYMLGSTYFWKKHIPDAAVTEALACVHAVQFARDLGLRRVELAGDSAMVISELKHAGIDRLKISGYIRDARQMLLGFEHFQFYHIKRGETQLRTCWLGKGSSGSETNVG